MACYLAYYPVLGHHVQVLPFSYFSTQYLLLISVWILPSTTLYVLHSKYSFCQCMNLSPFRGAPCSGFAIFSLSFLHSKYFSCQYEYCPSYVTIFLFLFVCCAVYDSSSWQYICTVYVPLASILEYIPRASMNLSRSRMRRRPYQPSRLFPKSIKQEKTSNFRNAGEHICFVFGLY